MEPKIRFKGFEGEWRNLSITEIASLKAGKSFNKLDAIDKPTVGYYPCYGGNGQRGYLPYYNQEGKYNIIGRQGALCGCINVAEGKFYATEHAVIVTPINVSDFEFLHESLIRANINQYATGAAQPGISVTNVNSQLSLNYPIYEEQKAIGKYFTSLDSQISASTSRLASLKQMKAASLQAMFPQEGETVPKIRFKGFEGEWKKVKLGDIAKFTKGQGYSKSDLKETGQPIILYGRMYTKYQFVIDEVDTFANLKDASILSEGDEIIMPASGETPEDIACASAVLVKDIILGGDLNIMHFDLTKISTPYIALVITYSKTHHDLSKCAQGKSVVHLHNGAISRATISLPSLAEQQAIASYFTSLDRQISLQSQRLEKLKQIKSACLDKMFV